MDYTVTPSLQYLQNQTLYPLVIPRKNTADVLEIQHCKQEGLYIQLANHTVLNSKVNSIREAHHNIIRITQQWEETPQLIIVIGLELGYHTQELLLQYPNIPIWVLEPSANKIISACNIHPWLPSLESQHLSIFYTPASKQLALFYNQKLLLPCKIFIHQPSFKHCPEYSSLLTEIQNIIEFQTINQNTIQYFERLWFSHILQNIPLYMKNISILDLSAYYYQHIVVIGAGPSLEKQISTLKQAKNKTLLIAVNTVIPRLLAEGIIPDIVIAIDPQTILFYNFIPLLRLKSPPILVVDPTVSPVILRQYQGNVIFSQVSLLQNLLHPPIPNKHPLDVGGSVITAGYSLAIELKAKSITLIGADLSYNTHQFHLRGNEQDLLYLYKTSRTKTWEYFYYKKSRPKKSIKYTGYFGTEVITDNRFLTYIQWLENRIQYYQNTYPTYNATQGGVTLQYAISISLEKYLASLPEKNIINPLALLFHNQRPKKMIIQILENLEDLYQQFRNCIESLNIKINYKNYSFTAEEKQNIIDSEWLNIQIPEIIQQLKSSIPYSFNLQQIILIREKLEQNCKLLQRTIFTISQKFMNESLIHRQ